MKYFIENIFKGIVIGIANIIPGLSGATLAFIMGIYEKLIQILSRFDGELLLLLKKFKIKEIKNHISFNFLAAILIGIIISFIVLSRLLDFLFVHYETHTWSYFFGIIIASIYYVAKYVEKWRTNEFLFLILGLIISFSLLFIEPNTENNNLLFTFFCGIVAVVGMLIPGLSGSYLLVLLGNYKLLLVDTIQNIINYPLSSNENYIHIKLFITFLLGQVTGILIFSRLIKWLLQNYKNKTFAILVGFIMGSLAFIWPWRNNTKKELIIENLSYPKFTDLNDICSVFIIFIGILTIILIEKIAEKNKNV